MSPIEILDFTLPRVGYFSAGHQIVRGQGDDERVMPTKTETITVHTDSPEKLEPFAREYGGEVVESPTSTERKERFFVVTEATEIRVAVPVDDDDLIFKQFMEAYTASGLLRQCDGVTCLKWREPNKTVVRNGKEHVEVGAINREAKPCICIAEAIPDDKKCKPTLRLDVLPIDVIADIPRGLGVFTVRSTGWMTNSQLKGDIALIRAAVGKLSIHVPLVLSIEQVHTRRGFMPKFRLSLAGTLREAIELAARDTGESLLAGLRPLALPGGEDEPVGGFVDKTPAATAPRPDDAGTRPTAPPADVGSDPSVLVIRGVKVPYVGGEKASATVPAITPAQLEVIRRDARKLRWDDADIASGIKHYTGHDINYVSRAGAEVFDAFLREEAKTREPA